MIANFFRLGQLTWPGDLTWHDLGSKISHIVQNWCTKSYPKRRGATRRGFLFTRKKRDRVVTYAPPPTGAKVKVVQYDLSPLKKFLYMSYCATVYCLHHWHVFNVSVINKFKVCLNNAARMFFGYERFCSASAMHVREGIDSFDVMFRKSSWIFLRRLGLTKNTVLSALVNSDVSIRSRYRAVWNRALLAV